jgi:hypothetical protein
MVSSIIFWDRFRGLQLADLLAQDRLDISPGPGTVSAELQQMFRLDAHSLETLPCRRDQRRGEDVLMAYSPLRFQCLWMSGGMAP